MGHGEICVNIWLITIGESVPATDGNNIKLNRAAILADLLCREGHGVVWWTSTFDHEKKRHRFDGDRSIEISPRYRLVLLHGTGYRKNISLARIVDHLLLAYKFFRRAQRAPRPDKIVCSYPTIELSYAAVKYGRRKKIPVVIDVRDLWPDYFLTAFPQSVRPVIKVFLFPFFQMKRSVFRQASAIVGTSPPYVAWGLKEARRNKTSGDADFPLADKKGPPGPIEMKRAETFWNGLQVHKSRFILCFVGVINKKFELETLIEAAGRLRDRGDILFVICGTGDRLAFYREKSKRMGNLIYPGFVGEAEKRALMLRSKIGLAPYHSTEEFKNNCPTKIFEYLSSGLPLLSCLKGIVETLLAAHQCGLTYANRNVEDFLGKLNYLIENAEVLRSLSRNAFKLYEQKFVADKVYTEMMNHVARRE